MRNLEVGDLLIAKKGCSAYLTADKKYPITKVGLKIDNPYNIFFLVDDEGDQLWCVLEDDLHNNGDWGVEFKEEADEVRG